MRTKLLLTGLLLLLINSIHAQQDPVIARNPEVITGKLIRITKPLGQMTSRDKLIPDVIVRDMNGILGKDEAFEEGEEAPNYPSNNNFAEDPALQKAYPNNPHLNAARAVNANFNGLGFTSVTPPDPTLCAGPNHIIQMINGSSGAYFKVFDKTGAQVVAQTYLDAITGKGGLGDPIALYDQLADRFVLTEFANSPETGSEGLIFAVSQTPDPAGAWYVYFFSTGTTFPDYPKMSVWTNAYYATTNDFANSVSYSGSTVYAFDKTKMLAGNASATMQKFTLGTTNKYFSMCPVLLQGNTVPPAGTGGLIAYMQDDAWTSTTADTDSIGLLEFKVNFTTPSATTVTHKASLAVAAFKSDICTATRGACISQPGSTTKLEALHQKIQNQPVYRNFGTYEGIVMVHAVDKGTNIAGIRWYELQKTTGNWAITQQSTYAPDNTHRWLPAIAYDANGNIALAFNVSSSATSVFPGIRYTGRKACDPLNTLTYSEDVIIAGTAANNNSRYGDYNHLVADPDGTRFWLTAEWNGATTWSTRIASFTLDPCTPALCGDPTGLNTTAITNTSATIGWTAVPSALSYDVDYQVTGAATWTNAATATTATSVNLASLTLGTSYTWRVRATCTAGSGNYITSVFSTTAPCNAPAGLNAGSITSNSAVVSWTAVSGAVSYKVEYKLNTSATWTLAASAATSTSQTLSGLSASSLYDWQVTTNCASGSSTASAAQFNTIAAPVCPGPYDVSTNGTTGGAAQIPLNTDIKGTISTSTDNDYYKFVITTGGTATLTLTTLPANYNLRLYNSAGTQLASSANSGTTSETISRTYTAGTYYARVLPQRSAFNATSCYTLRLQTGTATGPDPDPNQTVSIPDAGGLSLNVFPNPSENVITVSVKGISSRADLKIIDISGRVVMTTTLSNSRQLDVSRIPSGIYLINVREGDHSLSIRYMKK